MPNYPPVHDRAGDMAVQAMQVRRSFGTMLAIDDVSFVLATGQKLALLGPSGSGKSTLLSIIAGLETETSGRMTVHGGQSADQRLTQCALMPQRDLLLPWLNALDNACVALVNRGMGRDAARARARPLFQRVGLAEFQSSRPDELSGGMRQRVAFVRTLLAEKAVMLLDEPFGALDSIVRGQMQEWLRSVLDNTPSTLVLVTHDVEEALFLCDRVIVLSARPARIALDLDVDVPRLPARRQTITTREFVELRERALEALEVA